MISESKAKEILQRVVGDPNKLLVGHVSNGKRMRVWGLATSKSHLVVCTDVKEYVADVYPYCKASASAAASSTLPEGEENPEDYYPPTSGFSSSSSTESSSGEESSAVTSAASSATNTSPSSSSSSSSSSSCMMTLESNPAVKIPSRNSVYANNPVAFSVCENYLALGGQKSQIVIWDVSELKNKKLKKLRSWILPGSNNVFTAHFRFENSTQTHLLATGSQSGHVSVYRLPKSIVASSSSSSSSSSELEDDQPERVCCFKIPSYAMTVCLNKHNDLVAAGCNQGKVYLFDFTSPRAVFKLDGNLVRQVVFGNRHPDLMYAAGMDGSVTKFRFTKDNKKKEVIADCIPNKKCSVDVISAPKIAAEENIVAVHGVVEFSLELQKQCSVDIHEINQATLWKDQRRRQLFDIIFTRDENIAFCAGATDSEVIAVSLRSGAKLYSVKFPPSKSRGQQIYSLAISKDPASLIFVGDERGDITIVKNPFNRLGLVNSLIVGFLLREKSKGKIKQAMEEWRVLQYVVLMVDEFGEIDAAAVALSK